MSVRFSSSIPLTPPRFGQCAAARFGAESSAEGSKDEANVSKPVRILVKKPGLWTRTLAFFKLLFTFRIFGDKQKLMIRAVEDNNLRLLKTLLDYGVSPDFEYNGKVPLVSCAEKEPKEAIAGMLLLLVAGADVNMRNLRRVNALVRTILDDRYETFKFLLQNNASPDGITVRDLTPARLAFSLGRKQMLEDLIVKNADLARKDSFGQTILDDVANFEAIQKQDLEAMAQHIRKSFEKQQAAQTENKEPKPS